MKKQALLFLLLSSLVLTGCGGNNNGGGNTPGGIEDLGEFDPHTELQNQYFADTRPLTDAVAKEYIPAVNAEDNKSHKDIGVPNPKTIEFKDLGEAEKYYVQVATDAQFSSPLSYETTKASYDFYNGLLGQDYYVRAAVSEDALASAKVYKFKVKDSAPRNVYVPGVINFRDVGGWSSSLVSGAKVKQGLYYRCAKFDSIKAAGKKVIKELGIKLDIDMRDSYSVPSKSPANSTDWPVEILKGSVASGTESTRWEGTGGIADTYKTIFEAIAKADEKPIGLHCTHGADRTGIVSYFLLALLGVSKEDCAKDYVYTRFAGERAVLPENELKNWETKTEALEGATFADKTYKHLNEDFGIEASTLETIRALFIPGYTKKA